MKYIKIVLLVACVIVTSNAVKAANITPDLKKCASINNEKQRLQCFDDYIIKISALKHDNITPKADVAIVSEPKSDIQKMEAVVKSAKRDLRKNWKIELENGQVWIEKGGDKRASFSEGDTIVIVRGIMNSFQLKKVGTKRRIRVRRIL